MNSFLLVGPVLFVGTVLILERIQPGYVWKDSYISELSLGRFGWIQRANFIFSGFLIFLLCAVLGSQAEVFAIKLGWYFGAVAALVGSFAGIWNIGSIRDSLKTIPEKLHDYAYLVSAGAVAGMYLFVGWGYRDAPLILIFSGIVAFGDLFWIIFTRKTEVRVGIVQRVLVYSTLFWIEVVALLIIK